MATGKVEDIKMFYTDMHSHILPGVDDGAKNWEVTKQMLEMAYNQGIRTMFATSHSYPNRPQKSSMELKKLTKEVEELAKQIGEDFQIFSGNEILYRESILEELEEEKILTLADSQYVLVEFLPDEHYTRILHGVKRLVECGYCPVIAHMERIRALCEKRERVEEIVKCGAYIQINAESLMGGLFDKRKRFLEKMIAENLIHFMGSDCHNTNSRPPIMEDAIKKIRKKVPKASLEKLLYENPKKLLDGKYIYNI